MKNYNNASVELHKKFVGKIEVRSVAPIKTRDDLSAMYTPGVAEPCRLIAENPELAKTLTIKGRTVAVITDGSAVLGLGNIGPLASIPVMEGKCALFKEFAGIDAFPIALDTQDEDEIVETIKRIAPVFGGINLEDISAPRCFSIEKRLIEELDIPVFHDDQHGTAIVVLAGLINACKVTERDLKTARIIITGAGAAGIAIGKLLMSYGAKNIVMTDSKGALCSQRDDLNPVKADFLSHTSNQEVCGLLPEVLKDADIFIGVSKAGLVTAEMVRGMASNPIIFAMANPEPEILPDIAMSAGAGVIATGRSDFPNQVNNVLAFPGIFKGVFTSGATKITEKMKMAAAEALASYVKNPTPENIIPDSLDKHVSQVVADAVISAV